jgi:hypothetical protein
MHVPRHVLAFPAAIAAACLAFAGAASAATESFSGSVANGGCSFVKTVTVSGASRIEVALASTAQNNTNVLAEIVASNGKVVAGGSYAAYDTPGGGGYSIRVCSNYEAQSVPNQQFSGTLGTGPAGQPVLTVPAQPQPVTGGVLGKSTFVGNVNGKAAIRTRAGLAWFTVHSASNATVTLRIFDPMHGTTRVVKGLTGTYVNSTLRLTGHGLRFVLVRKGGPGRVSFTSSSFKASGTIVRGGFQIVA